MLSPALLLVPFLASPAVVVEGSGDCPTPLAVTEKLAAIMNVPEIEGAGERVTIASTAAGLTVALRDAQGALLEERSVSVEGSCEERAQAAAVIIAAWLTDIHPEYRNALRSVPRSREPAPPPAPPPPEEPRGPTPPAATPPQRAGGRPAGPSFSWAAAAGVQYSEPAVTPAFELSARFAGRDTGFGAFAFAVVTLPVERRVGAGTARSFRWPFGMGPLFRARPGALSVDFGVAPAVGWLHAQGEGFDDNESDDAAVFGALLGVRAATSWAAVRPFVSAGLMGWFTRSTVVAHKPEARLDLPHAEAMLLLGLSFEPR